MLMVACAYAGVVSAQAKAMRSNLQGPPTRFAATKAAAARQPADGAGPAEPLAAQPAPAQADEAAAAPAEARPAANANDPSLQGAERLHVLPHTAHACCLMLLSSLARF
jgi:hypothetical protein